MQLQHSASMGPLPERPHHSLALLGSSMQQVEKRARIADNSSETGSVIVPQQA